MQKTEFLIAWAWRNIDQNALALSGEGFFSEENETEDTTSDNRGLYSEKSVSLLKVMLGCEIVNNCIKTLKNSWRRAI